MGRKRKARGGRDVHGVLLLDKPSGMTSNEVLQHVKRLFRARKAGHTGSLDKSATGLLPLCLGEATKFSSFLLDADKRYRAVFRLGVETTTGDAEGEVVRELAVPELTIARVEQVLSRFRGDIEQIPPMYSALKHKGKRLYELAYQGIEVAREPRPVTIYSFDLIEFDGLDLTIDVLCSKGTYIRTLAEDVGRELGCGAHVSTLRRTGSGPFREEEMVTLDELESRAETGFEALDACLKPVDAVLREMPGVELVDSVAYYLKQGQPILIPNAPTEGMLRMYTDNGEFLGVGEILDDGRVAPRRLLTA
ncbi:MAG: tRNA pseudouridine(55) synthase TruB [Gammaproteobacteria bacterium]